MRRRETLYLVVSLDVEEEGLFGGRYARRAPRVTNTAQLSRLAPLLERGVRPTLFCAHSVLTDPASRAILARLRDMSGAEIGAHLHHWNTPPLDLDSHAGGQSDMADVTNSVPAASVPAALMAAKLGTLFRVGEDFQGAPLTSFRMGRWDLHRAHWPLLARRAFCATLRCALCTAPKQARMASRPGRTTSMPPAIPTGCRWRANTFLKCP